MMIDLATIQTLAHQRRDEFEVMRYMLECDDVSDEELDNLVEGIAQPIINAIDCTQCGNCCRSLDVYITQEDAQRLAPVIHVPITEIVVHEPAQAIDEWGMFRNKPCLFLNGKLCTVYPHRPDACRDYPVFTPDFRWILEDMIDGAALCPIIYHVLDRMVPEAERLSRINRDDYNEASNS